MMGAFELLLYAGAGAQPLMIAEAAETFATYDLACRFSFPAQADQHACFFTRPETGEFSILQQAAIFTEDSWPTR
jgi:hypothetical protein